jgi:IS30 family transposase
MTYDRGREMARHQNLSERTGLKVYFAHPHSPWERGINENTNGLLRLESSSRTLPTNRSLRLPETLVR